MNGLHRFLLMTVWGAEPPVTSFIRWSSTKPWLLTGILAHTGTTRHVNSLCRTLSKRGELVWQLLQSAYNWSHECLFCTVRKYETQQQGVSNDSIELTKMVYETGSMLSQPPVRAARRKAGIGWPSPPPRRGCAQAPYRRCAVREPWRSIRQSGA